MESAKGEVRPVKRQPVLSNQLTDRVAVTGEAVIASATPLRNAIDRLVRRVPIGWSEVASLAEPVGSRVSNFQPCLPPALEQELVAREELAPEDANAALDAWNEHKE